MRLEQLRGVSQGPWVWKADTLGNAASAQPGVICGSRCAPSLRQAHTKAARAGPDRSIFGERFIISIYRGGNGIGVITWFATADK